MKTTTFFVLSLLLVVSLPCFGLNYTITFTGSGASTTVGNVIVQNLTQGTSITVPAGNVLNLTSPTAVEQVSANAETIRIYSNGNGKLTLSIFAKQAGTTQINAFSLDGREVAGTSVNLQTGNNSFQLALPKGIFVIQVAANGYTYSAKTINKTGTQGNAEIVYTGTTGSPASFSPQKVINSGTTSMQYTVGDQLLYKGVSGNYFTIVTDVPTGSKTTNFNFMACTDADGNNYTTVTIGTQTWMVENLKTTQYNDNTPIADVTDITDWTNLSTEAYCWYNNDAATYKNTYGALYNWYAVNTGKLAPVGWHVATDAEWSTLTDYVAAHLGTSPSVDKALAATTDWTAYSETGTIGCNLTLNNSTGFSALPGGTRIYGFGTFGDLGDFGYWWSATEKDTSSAWGSTMFYYDSDVYRDINHKTTGFSVRCVRDSQ